MLSKYAPATLLVANPIVPAAKIPSNVEIIIGKVSSNSLGLSWFC